VRKKQSKTGKLVHNINIYKLPVFGIGFSCLILHLSVIAFFVFISSFILATYFYSFGISKLKLETEKNKQQRKENKKQIDNNDL